MENNYNPPPGFTTLDLVKENLDSKLKKQLKAARCYEEFVYEIKNITTLSYLVH